VNVLFEPMLGELPTCQNTLHACASTDQNDTATGPDGQHRSGLKDEDGVGIAASIQGQRAAEAKRARRRVDPGVRLLPPRPAEIVAVELRPAASL
jgi:hypothetical protein